MINISLVGRTTKDIELKQTPNGKMVCEFTLACDDGFFDGKKHTEFIRCEAWENIASVLSQYTQKGSLVSINATVRTTSWEKNGHTNYKTVFLVRSLELLSTQKREQEPSKDFIPTQEANLKMNDLVESDELPFY